MSITRFNRKVSFLTEGALKSEKHPRYLYKYRKLGGNTEKIITLNGMLFSSPLAFNDPFDFKLPIDPIESIRNLKEEELVFCLNNFMKNLQDKSYEIPEENILFAKWLTETKGVESIVKGFSEIFPKMKKIIDKELKETGICCFSKEYDNILMWSHYAQDHKGVCLKFDTTEDNDFFSPLITVDYMKKLNLNIIEYLSEPNRFAKDTVKIKYFDWFYEREVRIVKISSSGFNSKNGFLKFKPNALKEVIFGLRTDKEDILKYIDLCKNHNNNIALFKMESPKNGRFELEKIRINPNNNGSFKLEKTNL